MENHLRVFLTVVLIVTSQAIRPKQVRGLNSEPVAYKLCTYDNVSYNKCLHLLHTAQNSSIELPVECVQKENRATCIRSVAKQQTNFLVADGHGYQEARSAGLYPVIFERDNSESVFVAVVPRNFSLVDLYTAPIDVDQSNHRAFHAAAFFNLRRGHDICLYLSKASVSTSIKIVDSTEYNPNSDEVLICPDRSYAEASDYKRCNFEAELQRAIFIPRRSSRALLHGLQRIVRTIFDRFGPDAERLEGLNSKNFNFFTTFNGEDNVIFKNNAVGFDFNPTYLNGVNENLFNLLHCNTDDHSHDPQQLE